MRKRILCLIALSLMSCQSVHKAPPRASLSDWIAAQEKKSWENLLVVVSPKEPKQEGGPSPLEGAVVAGLSKKDPDYYFHWVRDSAHVMRAVFQGIDEGLGNNSWEAGKGKLLGDFVSFSSALQSLRSSYSLGEPRYTVNGELDALPWSRPQYDGPALRALALMKQDEARSDQKTRRVIRADLLYLPRVIQENGFDLWEELKGEHYHTRLLQLSALETGLAEGFVGSAPAERKTVEAAIASLRRDLEAHWSSNKKYLLSQTKVTGTDGYTRKSTDLDSAVVIAVIDADRRTGAHSVTDPRVQATVHELERLFARSYPINKMENMGVASGRYQGDVYFGGNPWFLVTAYYAQFYYRLAAQLKAEGPFQLDGVNREFAQAVAGETPADSLKTADWIRAFVHRGDMILERIKFHAPPDGQLYEQFDKVTGKPVSSKGLGWAHAALLGALSDRRKAK